MYSSTISELTYTEWKLPFQTKISQNFHYSGIYLACILYHEDKVLVTNEDFVPVIEIDETYPSCLHTDYHWLMKVGYANPYITTSLLIQLWPN